jgi:hypothetical protein
LNAPDHAWLENYIVERDELLQGFEAEKKAVLKLKHLCMFLGLLDEKGKPTALATSKEDQSLEIVIGEDLPMILDNDEFDDPMDCDPSTMGSDNFMNPSEFPQPFESISSTPGPFSSQT